MFLSDLYNDSKLEEIYIDSDLLISCFLKLACEDAEIKKRLEDIILDEILDVNDQDNVE